MTADSISTWRKLLDNELDNEPRFMAKIDGRRDWWNKEKEIKKKEIDILNLATNILDSHSFFF